MMSTATWPEQWAHTSRRRPAILFAALVTLFLFAAGTAIRHHLTGWPSGALYTAMFGLLFAELAWFIALTRLRPRKSGAKPLRRKATGDAAMVLEMPYSKAQFTGFALLALTAAAPFAVGIIGAMDKDRPQVDRAALMAVVALVLLSLPLVMLRGSFALGTVQLSPSGIYHRGWTHESFLPWDGVAEVRAVPHDGPEIWVVATADARWHRRRMTRLWPEDRLPDLPMLRILGRDLAGDPALLHALVDHYHRHPEDRAELGTDRGIERARALASGA
ncbi:hypothetical protein LZ318_34075 [Saccharopolyspora indica]|uniref:hypothetical protein n=1 Tax=Saccharopolyspora indica TaxID=1229659 RepID=UPI0022EA7EBC|nr:hypothetical protein [Saccharopolyspora indica]MDA3647495.1 hypothetical protein [Saccharopolyspora indica]